MQDYHAEQKLDATYNVSLSERGIKSTINVLPDIMKHSSQLLVDSQPPQTRANQCPPSPTAKTCLRDEKE